MRLNLAILADCLADAGFQPTSLRTGNPYKFELSSCQAWAPGSPVSPEILYLVRPDKLPELPRKGHVSLLCIGGVPEGYGRGHALWITLPDETDEIALLNATFMAFSSFASWDGRMREACLDHESLHAIASIAFEKLGNNNFCCWDSQDSMLFFVHRADDPYLGLYPQEENAYLDEEGSLRIRQEEYAGLLDKKMPVLFPKGAYAVDSLLYNLQEDGSVFARVTLDATQREFRPSDYSLLFHVGNLIRRVLLEWNVMRVGTSRDFDEMVAALIDSRLPYDASFDAVLHRQGWKRHDDYRCIAIAPKREDLNSRVIAQDVIYIQSHFSGVYAYSNSRSVLVIVNQSKQGQDRDVTELLSEHFAPLGYSCGVSATQRNFTNLRKLFREAWTALEIGSEARATQPLYRFEDFQLETLLRNSSGEFLPEDYISPAVRTLIEYDKENDGALLQTVVTYLRSGLNVTLSTSLLHIHKTTFYYRIRRAQEISGLNLDDYRTRLYLMILADTVQDIALLSLA